MTLHKIYIVAFSVLSVVFHAQNKKEMSELIRNEFQFAEKQYNFLIHTVPQDKMPQSYKDGKLVTKDISWWCSGFYPGSLWMIYEQTKNPEIRKEAERTLKIIETNKTFTRDHDLGFMMFCSYGNAYRITKDPKYKDIILTSAKSLSTRFRPGMQAILSWDKMADFKGPVIIDNMMNLEMLVWASQNGGDKKLEEIAVAHANTTMKNHFRPDYSSYHVIDYDVNTGQVLAKKTFQGYSDSSAWARGQGWALYGYTMMYRFTKDKRYLVQAQNIAKFILNNPTLPKDKIPYWDFNDPEIPNVPRDASAAAIIASALLELGQYTSGDEKKSYVDSAKQMIISLSGERYQSKLGENGGFLLMHSTGGLPLNSEIDVPLIYADYYFLEALKRYKDWY
ncbi:unsaturated chondroitin disaccharide hydrolase [Chryseobacterium ginsenosidimutans]|uniref:glycoside hydrolase family 88 protein n=1 Tax=Chryseobacterium ginsenosidimutans TaxID=687846 RepID=UPI002789B62F|nr:glycoside hydrolase family 88 protein [Chryseobacterium ginsenosidimutans]MDQ0595206.1 unsaturated chondroitin disaccharide hydrolase [Chryseobacterium ginsenosidimutans]